MNAAKRKFNSCQGCVRNDSYDDMVCCDNCDDWYHYKCAGVGKEIKDLDWSCKICQKTFSGIISSLSRLRIKTQLSNVDKKNKIVVEMFSVIKSEKKN